MSSKPIVDTSPAKDSRRELFWDLSRGMHDLAQPLSSLRAQLELAALQHPETGPISKLADKCMVELARTLELLTYIQELLRVAREDPPDEESDLVAALRLAVEDLECVFKNSGIRTSVHCDEAELRVRAVHTRLRHIFFYLLQMAQQSAATGDLIAIDVQAQAHRIVVVIQNTNGAIRDLPDPVRSHIHRGATLAREISKALGLELKCGITPFAAQLIAPIGVQR